MRNRRTRAARRVTVDAGGWSSTGRRADNQDRWCADGRLAVVSDGMGGYRGGALAAQLAVDAVVAALGSPDAVTEHRVVAAFERANAAVRSARAADPDVAEMGATLTVAVALDLGRAEHDVALDPGAAPAPADAVPSAVTRWLVAHLGDSPAYLVTPAAAHAVTVDHTVSAALLASGALTAAEAGRHPGRHLLLRAVGSEPTVEVDLVEVTVAPGEALVLVSDGVSGSLTDDEVGGIVRVGRSAGDAAQALVERALEAGASDNVTAVVLRMASSPV